MSDVSDYLKTWVLDEVFTGEKFVALYRTVGGDPVEVNAQDYERQPVTLASAGSGVRTSQNSVSFLSENTWGEVTHIGLCDSLSGGNMLMQKKLDTPVDVQSAVQIDIAADDLSVYEE